MYNTVQQAERRAEGAHHAVFGTHLEVLGRCVSPDV
jgi:hypothetical protein